MIGTAAMAGAVAGLGGLGGKGLVVLPHQIFVGHTVVHMAPRGHLVQPNGTLAVELGINAQILKHLHPGVILEALFPAVEVAAALVGLHDDRSQAAVALGEYAFEEAGGAVVVVDLDLAAVDTFQQVLLLGLQALLRSMGTNWKGVWGLGTKQAQLMVTCIPLPLACLGLE